MKTIKSGKSGNREAVTNAEKKNGESKEWRKGKKTLNNFKSNAKGGPGAKRRGTSGKESSGGVMDAIRSLYFFSHVSRFVTDPQCV